MDKPTWFRALRAVPNTGWSKAFKELFVITGISLLPLIFKFGVRLFKGEGGKALTPDHALTSVLREGELLFVAIGLIATIVWLASQDFSRSKFEERIWFVLWSIVGIAAAVFFIGFNPDYNAIPESTVKWTSILILAITAIMYLLMSVFCHFEGSDYKASLKQGESSLSAQLGRRK